MIENQLKDTKKGRKVIVKVFISVEKFYHSMSITNDLAGSTS